LKGGPFAFGHPVHFPFSNRPTSGFTPQLLQLGFFTWPRIGDAG
jgi:hypothetical protein